MAIQTYPPTEKMHQIIARTAMFVSKHGGQSEIVLRVKQGKNPSFGFLMPDDHLHPYFRFLVDHQELLQAENDEKPHREVKISDGSGALSLLGSLYGNGDDDDGATENSSVSKPDAPGEPFEASGPISHGSEYTKSLASTCLKDESVLKRIIPSKEKAATTKKSSKSVSSSGTKKVEDKLLASFAPSIPKIEPLMIEPPSDLKRLVDKIVEFIIKNGKQFEAVLMEQDSGHGRFPFLLPSNQYHPYYLKVLEKAQESKLSGKSIPSEKDRHGLEKKTSLSKEIDSQSAGCDIPYDSDRKEKFKMVLGKSKKDGPEPPSKTTSHQQQFGVTVDAAAAAAILQAATRGIKNPNFGFLSTSSLNGNQSQAPRSSSDRIQKSDQNTEQTVTVPVASAIAKSIALEAASEADSSEAHLTREQKLKAERLKRAKMFVAMLKSGAPALKTEFSRDLSVEPHESGDVSRSAEEAVVNLVAREREGSSAPVDVDKNEKSEKKHSGDEHERRSKRKYRSRSGRHEGEEEEEEEEDDDDDDDEDTDDEKAVGSKHLTRKRRKDEGREQKNDDDKCERKKHRSHRSSRREIGHVDEEDRDDKYLRKKRQSDHSSREEFDGDRKDDKYSRKDDKYSRKKRLSSREEINVEYEKDDEKMRHRSKQSSSREGTDEDNENERDDDDKFMRKKHRSTHRETYDEDEYSRKKHHSRRSSREEIDDEEEDDGEERNDKRSHKKHHKSRRSSRHTKKDGHRKCRTSSKDRLSRRHRHKHESDRSSDEEDDKIRPDRSRSYDNKPHKKKKGSQVELEEGEICSKLLEGQSTKGGTSTVSLVGGAGREASVDDLFNSSSYHQDSTTKVAAPSNLSQVTVVPDDLRAKVRAMLRATM